MIECVGQERKHEMKREERRKRREVEGKQGRRRCDTKGKG